MKTIDVKCNYCGNIVIKSLAEYKRRLKNNCNVKFYCNLSCSAKKLGGWSNVPKEKRYDISKHSGRTKDEYSKFRPHLKRIINRKKYEVSITLSDLKELWEKQNGKCALTKINLKPFCYNDSVDIRFSPSLDRIDSSKGYIKGNIQWVCGCINLAKSTLSNEKIKEWISEIKNN